MELNGCGILRIFEPEEQAGPRFCEVPRERIFPSLFGWEEGVAEILISVLFIYYW